MNYEDAEIILCGIEIMHKADAGMLGPERASVLRQARLEELASMCQVLWPEITLNRSVDILTQLTPCRDCEVRKPVFLFKPFSTKCMACEAENYLKERREGDLMCQECGDYKSFEEFGRNMNGTRKSMCLECFRIKVRAGKAKAKKGPP